MARGKNRTQLLGIQGCISSDKYMDWDFLYEASTTRNPLFHIGDRTVLPDGRVFRYAKCGADLPGMKWGVKAYNKLVTQKASIVTAAAAGDKSLTVTFDGDFWDTDIAVDELRGGYISIYNSSTVREQRGIIGNSAITASGGATTIYLDASIKTAFTSTVACEILANPYSNVRYSTEGCSVLGMPNVLATSGQYFWIQTWGICRVTPTGAELGGQNGERMFVFGTNGAVCSLKVWHDTGLGLGHSYQMAGFLVEWTDEFTAGSAAPFINLQINP